MPGRDRSDDERRFTALFHEHYDRLLAYALRRVDADRAHEVVSETWLVAWRRLADVPDDALPWLFGVARRVIANRRRSDRRRAALIRRVQANLTAHSVEEHVPEGSRDLSLALARLSDGDREILMLVAWDGLDTRRAAATLGVKPAVFSVRLHRARRRLLKELEARGHEVKQSAAWTHAVKEKEG
jgi:RNA polymerase sigma-70 factor (ECF subfamily)